MGQVAFALARRGGNLAEGQTEGYDLAIVRVSNPAQLSEVRQKITDLASAVFRSLTNSIRFGRCF